MFCDCTKIGFSSRTCFYSMFRFSFTCNLLYACAMRESVFKNVKSTEKIDIYRKEQIQESKYELISES